MALGVGSPLIPDGRESGRSGNGGQGGTTLKDVGTNSLASIGEVLFEVGVRPIVVGVGVGVGVGYLEQVGEFVVRVGGTICSGVNPLGTRLRCLGYVVPKGRSFVEVLLPILRGNGAGRAEVLGGTTADALPGLDAIPKGATEGVLLPKLVPFLVGTAVDLW